MIKHKVIFEKKTYSERYVKNISILNFILNEVLYFIWNSQRILEFGFLALFSSPQGSCKKFSPPIILPP